MADRKPIFDAFRSFRGGRLTQSEVAAIDTLVDNMDKQDKFSRWLPHILKHEGGYVNHPKDPGGATNKGIIQATYDGWRVKQKLPKQSVKFITDDEVAAIYRRDYWDAIKGDDLPLGVDYCIFDFAVNSGVTRASKYLQSALAITTDGVVGPKTVSAAASVNPASVIKNVCRARINFLKGLSTWPTFGKGWQRRVEEVEFTALGASK